MKNSNPDTRPAPSIFKNTVPGTLALMICMSASVTAVAGNKKHNNHQVFTDYAKVVHVEPVYRTVTRRTPQRTCHAPQSHHPGYNHGRQNNGGQSNGGHPRVNTAHSPQWLRPEAVFIGSVIGGAIGHELTRSVNGRSSTGATLAGAAIGAGLVASHQQQRNRNSRQHITHTPRSQPNDKRHGKRKRHSPRCTTTEHIQQVREPDGYQVTYRFRGRTFQTHTDHHPGDKIPVRVALSR